MRSIILTGGAALAAFSSPLAAQYYDEGYYEAPQDGYALPARPHVETLPPFEAGYDRDEWLRECEGNLRDRRYRDARRQDCWAWLSHYENTAAATQTYGYDDADYAYRGGYRDAYRGDYDRGYSYGYEAPSYRAGGYRYADGYSSGYSGRYGGGGGYTTTQSGSVLVIVEQQASERYVPVIVEEII